MKIVKSKRLMPHPPRMRLTDLQKEVRDRHPEPKKASRHERRVE